MSAKQQATLNAESKGRMVLIGILTCLALTMAAAHIFGHL